MAYAFTQDAPIKAEVHAKIVDRLGHAPLKGLIVRVASATPTGSLRYTEVWESKELCDQAFEQRLHPAINGVFEEMGVKPGPDPERREMTIINVMRG
jgi:hypothetical protein